MASGISVEQRKACATCAVVCVSHGFMCTTSPTCIMFVLPRLPPRQLRRRQSNLSSSMAETSGANAVMYDQSIKFVSKEPRTLE